MKQTYSFFSLCLICFLLGRGSYVIFSKPHVTKRELQVQLYKDSVWVYENDTLIGSYVDDPTTNTQLDSLFLKANQ